MVLSGGSRLRGADNVESPGAFFVTAGLESRDLRLYCIQKSRATEPERWPYRTYPIRPPPAIRAICGKPAVVRRAVSEAAAASVIACTRDRLSDISLAPERAFARCDSRPFDLFARALRAASASDSPFTKRHAFITRGSCCRDRTRRYVVLRSALGAIRPSSIAATLSSAAKRESMLGSLR